MKFMSISSTTYASLLFSCTLYVLLVSLRQFHRDLDPEFQKCHGLPLGLDVQTISVCSVNFVCISRCRYCCPLYLFSVIVKDTAFFNQNCDEENMVHYLQNNIRRIKGLYQSS